MRVLITGGCGFVGRHFACRLADDGHGITLVDNMLTGLYPRHWPFQPKAGWRVLDLYDEDFRGFVHKSGAARKAKHYDLILHCAAVVGGRLTIENEPLRVATDLAIDADLFNWLVRTGTPKQQTIYFSSSAVYPVELQLRVRHCALAESLVNFDNRLGLPDQTYGWAKLTGELLMQHAVKAHGLNVIAYRPFSGYGSDQALDYPFPAIVKRVLEGQTPLLVWGSGEQLRDFIHIDDVIDAVLATRDKLAPGDVLNIGSGVGISFTELAETICRVLGHAARVDNDVSKPEGVFARVADPYKLASWFHPVVTLEEGIRRVADFIRTTLPPA